jgi:Mn-dependent DtxR family transcriptional regulator
LAARLASSPIGPRLGGRLGTGRHAYGANGYPLRSPLCHSGASPHQSGRRRAWLATRAAQEHNRSQYMPENSAPVARSSTVEDYLEQILDLNNTNGYARVADIALGLKISQASVTNMVQRLDSEGLLKYEKYRGLVLTTAGETLARNIMQRHQLLTDFLRMLGIDEDVIYHDVEGMEHHISPQTLHAIRALVSALQENPELLARIKQQAHGN